MRQPPRSHPPFLRAAAALAGFLVVAACAGETRRGDPDLQVRVGFEPDPPTMGAAAIHVDVSDVDWSPRNGARVILTGLRGGLELEVDTALGQGAGRYLTEDFRFEVAGDWVLRIRVESPDGRWVEVERDIEVAVPEE